jgi:hypothetical protein
MQNTFSKALAALVLTTSALLVGCGEGEVPKADIEKGAMEQLTASVGKPSPAITCPSGLKAKVGTKLVCSMVIDGKTYDVDVTANEVAGGTVKYSVAVADKPRG